MFRKPFLLILKEDDQEEENGPVNKSFTIRDDNGREVGKAHVSWGDEGIGKYAIELLDVEVDKEHEPLKVVDNVIHKLFRKMKDIHRIYVMSRADEAPFWRKLGFRHLNNNYFIRDRAQ